MLNIRNILVEHFHRLKCANFYLLFDTAFVDVASVHVHLRPTEIDVILSDTRTVTIALASISMEIQINSLSLLIVRGNLISFRINTSTCDTFRTEIYALKCEGDVERVDSGDNSSTLQLKLYAKAGEEFKLICDTCSGPLTGSLCFRRVLELPSDNMDLNEWFCHRPHDDKAAPPEPSHRSHTQHCHASNIDTPIDPKEKYNVTKFTPADGDLLYGNFFVLLQRNQLANINVDTNNQMIHCRRCFKHVGEMIKDQSARMWNGNVRMLNDCMPSQRMFDGESDFNNFQFIIDRISNDFRLLGRQSQKLLFEAQAFNGTTKFLFVQLMAKSVDIFQAEPSNGPINDHITLSRIDGTKCLYRCEQNADQALLRFWQNDVNVVSAQVSIEMLECVVDHLENYSNFVPETYRMNNGFCLSYLCRVK